MSENYAGTNLEEWLAWTLSRGAPDPNQSAQEHPVVVYLDQIVTRLTAAEATVATLQVAAASDVARLEALEIAAASDGWAGF